MANRVRGYIPKVLTLREVETAFLSIYRSIDRPISSVSRFLARNLSGSKISKGAPVIIDTAQGLVPVIVEADADNATVTQTVGIVEKDGGIEHDESGFVTVLGTIEGIDTSTWSKGDDLFVSTTSGVLTNTEPVYPIRSMKVGIALDSQTQGSIFVYLNPGNNFEDIRGITISGLSTSDVLQYNGTQWVNVPTLPASQITSDRVAGSTYSTVQHMQDIFHSAGVTTGGVISDDGDGTITVPAGTGLIRATNDATASLKWTNWSAESGAPVTLTDVAMNYVYVEWNSGNPQVVVDSAERADFHTNILLGTVYRAGTTLHITSQLRPIVGDHALLMIRRTQAISPFARESGAILGGSNLNIQITAGAFWEGLIRFTTAAFDSSGTDRFIYYYRNGGAGGWTQQIDQSEINVTQYDNDSGTLQTLTANRYAVGWVYVAMDGMVYVLYGQGDYVISAAEAASAPASVPPHFENHARLVGKVIAQKNDTVFTEVASAFDTAITTSFATDHNELLGLQGGSIGDYYHLLNSEVAKLSNIEDFADVTDPTNVDGAGAVMNDDTTTAEMSFVVDEDNMASDLATKVPTQQSVKAYVDSPRQLQALTQAECLHLRDEKANNVDGGTFTQGAWRLRDINTVVRSAGDYAHLIYELHFDTITNANIAVDEVITGATSGATCKAAEAGTPVTSPLKVYDVVGTFVDNEVLTGTGTFSVAHNNLTPEDSATGLDYGNMIRLSAGQWYLDASIPAFNVGSHRARLYDWTGSAVVMQGTNVRANNSNGVPSLLRGSFPVSGNRLYQIEHQCETTATTNGFGRACNFSALEVYSDIFLFKGAADV